MQKYSRHIQQSRAATDPSSDSTRLLTTFNIVFCFVESDGATPLRTRRYLDSMYKNILAKLTAALKYEQVARAYLRTEIDLILALKEGLEYK
jgi:hypothetical protein